MNAAAVEHIRIKAADLCVVAGPSYLVQMEDGLQSRYDYYVVYHNRYKDALTWRGICFITERPAKKAMEAISEHGIISLMHWEKGDPWSAYHQGMSLQSRWSAFGPAWQHEQEEKQCPN